LAVVRIVVVGGGRLVVVRIVVVGIVVVRIVVVGWRWFASW
jgi:hypothetical protein